jgi:hypothetical protein
MRQNAILTRNAILCLAQAVLIAAQRLSYITTTITSCYNIGTPKPITTSTIAATISPQNDQGTVDYSMPSCSACGCSSCTLASTFTTSFSAFCATGLTAVTYTVTETYSGMSSLPAFATPTSVPYGFTTTAETCTGSCGARAVVATVTYPRGGQSSVTAGPTHTSAVTAAPGPSRTNAPDQTKGRSTTALQTRSGLSTVYTGTTPTTQLPQPPIASTVATAGSNGRIGATGALFVALMMMAVMW